MKYTMNTTADPIVESVKEQFDQRSLKGQEQYLTTLAENDRDDFLQHLKEELMDSVLYIQKLQTQSNLKELVKFGNYLFSKERCESVSEENIFRVTDADLENYKLLNK